MCKTWRVAALLALLMFSVSCTTVVLRGRYLGEHSVETGDSSVTREVVIEPSPAGDMTVRILETRTAELVRADEFESASVQLPDYSATDFFLYVPGKIILGYGSLGAGIVLGAAFGSGSDKPAGTIDKKGEVEVTESVSFFSELLTWFVPGLRSPGLSHGVKCKLGPEARRRLEEAYGSLGKARANKASWFDLRGADMASLDCAAVNEPGPLYHEVLEAPTAVGEVVVRVVNPERVRIRLEGRELADAPPGRDGVTTVPRTVVQRNLEDGRGRLEVRYRLNSGEEFEVDDVVLRREDWR